MKVNLIIKSYCLGGLETSNRLKWGFQGRDRTSPLFFGTKYEVTLQILPIVCKFEGKVIGSKVTHWET